MALAAQKALLDELMGKNRNACNGENANGPHWSDDDVCKSFLCGFCPHELFVNTKTDLGPCSKTHDERMKEAYERSKRCGKMGYEDEFVRYLKRLLEDVEKRIRRGHERLAVNKSVNNPDPLAATEKKEKIAALTKRINDLVKQAEDLGMEGKVDQAQGVLKICEQLKSERSQLEGDARPGMTQGKELEVCEICGAFRIKDDAPQRVEEHLSGKMHLGFAKIRDYLRQYSERRPSPPLRSDKRPVRSSLDRSPRIRDRRSHDDRSPRSRSNGHRYNYHHRDSSHHRSRHDRRDDRRRTDRSRSRSRRADRHRYEHSVRSSKRNTSPFSAARRPPEGAEDY
ncbi:putative mrna binding protein [Fasciolopsis buskii]|uniref:Putative mrna binding protein n=1 Tax=Fasciolopsis buskii TaxID=27845 RepID=A0A8E0VIQ6_9TREM|nr:putative mrna binding protein [Fasciolopsis buski]